MTILKLIELVEANRDAINVWGLIIFALSLFVEFTPIKFNPWSAILGWIGSKTNARLNTKLSQIEKKVDKLNTDLDQHIAESVEKELKDTRKDILEFCNSCMNGRRHTKEQFEFVIKQCDAYTKYIRENHVENGYIESAIKEIKRLNDKCIQENSYLKEGEDYEIHS